VDRARLRLTVGAVLLGVLVPVAGCGGTTGGDVRQADASQSGSRSGSPGTMTSTPVGYPLPRGRTVERAVGGYDRAELAVGDLLLVRSRKPVDIRDVDPTVLVYAESNDTGQVFQAVAAGRTRMLTGPVPEPSCDGSDCTGRAAPPRIDVTVVAQ
jgi:hypothetical protein